MSVEIHTSGPIFDGRAAAAAGEYCDRVTADVAQQGYANWMTELNAHIRNPTPYYETQVHVEGGGRRRVINDRGIIYGPWLEGVGSRNSPVTIFPGYHSLRSAFHHTEAQAHELAVRSLREFLPRMQ